ncbi:hypothetical protein ACFL35_14365 [Candidatus Riflebacteria bacterium]
MKALENTPTNSHLQERVYLYLLFFTALILRLAYLWDFCQTPFFENILPAFDQSNYHRQAILFAEGDLLNSNFSKVPPLYSYFLGSLYYLFNKDLLLVRAFQLLFCGLLNTCLVFVITRNLFGFPPAIVAGSIYAFWGPSVFYEAILLRAALTSTLLLCCLYFLLKSQENKKSYFFPFLCILFSVFICLCRPNFIPQLFICLFFLLRFHAYRLKVFLVFLVILGFLFLPFCLRNYRLNKSFSPFGSQGGKVILHSNLTTYSGYSWNPPPRYISLEQSGFSFALPEVVSIVLKDWWTNPHRVLPLFWKKFRSLVHNEEIPSNVNFYLSQNIMPGLRWTLAYFAPLFLSFLGFTILCFILQREKEILLLTFVLGLILSLLPFYIVSRLRLPIVPVFIIAAVGFWTHLLQNTTEFKLFTRFILICFFVISIPFFNRPLGPKIQTADYIRATDYLNYFYGFSAMGDVYMTDYCVLNFYKLARPTLAKNISLVFYKGIMDVHRLLQKREFLQAKNRCVYLLLRKPEMPYYLFLLNLSVRAIKKPEKFKM